MDQVLQFPPNSSSNIDIKIEQVETIKLENNEVKLEKLHHSIHIEDENLLKNHQLYLADIDQVLQFPSNSSSNIEIKTEPLENIGFNLEDLHHSIDIKDETPIRNAEEVESNDHQICSRLTSGVHKTKENGKRKQIVVSLEQKLKAFRRLDNGESIAKISSDLGVGRTTIIGWKKGRTKLENWSNSQMDFGKIKRKCKYEKVNEALFLWFTQQINKGNHVTGPILKEKALQFQREFNEGNQEEPPFTASDGWLHHWKRRYRIRRKFSGWKLPANECSSEYSQPIIEDNDSDNSITLSTEIPACENMINDNEEESMKHDEQEELIVNDIATSVNGCENEDKHDATLLVQNTKKIGKRKKILVTIGQKLKAFRRLDSGEPISKISSDLGVGRTTIIGWKKRRTKIENWSNSQIDCRKIKKKCKYEKVNEALFSWFTEQINKGTNIDGPTLKEKALQFHGEFNEGNQGEPTFGASEGWLQCWRKRYGIRRNFSGEKLSANECPSEYSQTMVEDNDGDNSITLLPKTPNCENMICDDEEELIKHDEQQKLTVNDIATSVNNSEVTLLEKDNTNRISHSDGIKALDTVLAYVKQQVEMTPADIMFLQRFRNFAAKKKRNESNS